MFPRNEKPERGYIRQNHPFPPFYLPVKIRREILVTFSSCNVFQGSDVRKRKISRNFTAKSGVRNGEFHANFTLLGGSAEKLFKLWKPTCRRTARTNFIIKIWVSQFVGLLRRNHLYGLILHGFSARICARIFCTDFLHGFLHGFFAQICAWIFAWIFLRGFVAQIIARIFARTFCMGFLGYAKALAEKRQKSTERIP